MPRPTGKSGRLRHDLSSVLPKRRGAIARSPMVCDELRLELEANRELYVAALVQRTRVAARSALEGLDRTDFSEVRVSGNDVHVVMVEHIVELATQLDLVALFNLEVLVNAKVHIPERG